MEIGLVKSGVKLDIDWHTKNTAEDIDQAIIKYGRYLKNLGIRDATVRTHSFRVQQFLRWAKDPRPPVEKATEYREILLDKGLARSSLNNFGFAVRRFYEMHNLDFTFPFLKPNDTIPYYFTESDVQAIFDAASHHIRDLAMLMTLFYGTLRASDLCNLDIDDINLQDSTLRIRDGKGGKDAIVFIKYECIQVLRKYLYIRPDIENNDAVFVTDYGNRWYKTNLYRLFLNYKRKAHVTKPGGLHVFGRHTPATLMIAKGCDVSIVQKILRHNDIKTTLRYIHINDKIKRDAYEKYLVL